MPPRGDEVRLDALLVARGLARSRAHAAEIIRTGRALIDGRPVAKPATPTPADAKLEVVAEQSDHDVSRAARKLRGALVDFGVHPTGRRCIDVGSSTGGFTQVLLEHGATHVVAIDVGTDQLVPQLRADPRVTVLEGTHVGHLADGEVAPAELVTADLSFISLRQVIGVLAALTEPGGQLLPMIKPQFEVGRSGLDKHGVVTDPHRQRDSVIAVIEASAAYGFGAVGIRRSQLPGPSGNQEYFVLLERGPGSDPETAWAEMEAAPAG